MKNQDNNITNNIKNDVQVAGTDLFADSEDFLNELTDSELGQIVGGGAVDYLLFESALSILECQ